ncbi:hypothetical protein [Oceanobacillus timonensis]|uniref:hypothetical protein n=1 Tax=Oceanobacillus timonensis TaxID=1926285 RepID=UPI0009BBB27E|nr:hypothetical protein [Oceanobacillus timonensis]
MLYVVFTNIDHTKIPKFEKIPFKEAVTLTNEIEMEMRPKKKVLSGDFYLIRDEDNETVYSGTFNFGSKFAPNLFIHIKKNLPKIRTSKEKEKQRLLLIEEMEEQTEEAYKQEEDLSDDDLSNLDKSKISHLKRWQRRTVYGVGLFFALAFLGCLTFFMIQVASFQNEYNQVQANSEEQEILLSNYEKALLDDREDLITYLSEKEELTEEQRMIYANHLVNNEQYEELVNLFDEDPILALSYLTQVTDDIATVEAFNEAYPTSEGEFEIAYANNNYKDLLAIEDVEMNVERSKKKTYALLKTGNIEDARAELENNNDEELSNKIDEYASLTEQIEELNSQIADLEDDIDDADTKKARRNLRGDKNDLEDERDELENQRGDL